MIRKDWAFALGILSLSTAMVAADQTQQSDKNPPMPMGVTSQPSGVITPPVAPAVTNGADVFLTADFIYWRSHQDGLPFAQAVTNGTVTAGQSVHSGKVYQAESRFEPGFKVGFGLEFEHDGWDLFAQYTWLNPGHEKTHAHAPSSTSNTELTGMLGVDSGVAISQPLQSASGKYQMYFNVLDLELGRNFFVSRYMTLRPHFGLKTAWINQYFDVKYDYSTSGTFGGVTFNNEKVDQKQRSWGMGIRAGLDPVWHFTRNFGLYGNLALTGMYTYYKDKLTDKVYDDGSTTYTQLAKQKTGFHDITPVIEFGLGLNYMTWFYDESYMFEIRAGWEEQVWINTNHFLNTSNVNTNSSGNLTLEGFTLMFGFHF